MGTDGAAYIDLAENIEVEVEVENFEFTSKLV